MPAGRKKPPGGGSASLMIADSFRLVWLALEVIEIGFSARGKINHDTVRNRSTRPARDVSHSC